MRKDITILGGGIIGVLTAYYAIKNNYSVCLIEKNKAPGMGASFQNGGQLSFSHFFSVCDINIFRYLLKNIYSNNSPINVSYLELIKNPSWSLKFLKNLPKNKERQYLDLFDLACKSQLEFQNLAKELPEIGIKKTGSIQLFRQTNSFNKVQNLINSFDKHNINHQVISNIDLKQYIANYKDNDFNAIYFPDDMSGNTYHVIETILNYLKNNKNFKLLTNQTIKNINISNGKITDVTTNNNNVITERLLVTTGVYIEELVQHFKLRLPILPLKGYSFNCKKLKLEKCLIDHDSKIVLTPFDGCVRVSGLYDFEGFNKDISLNRLNFIKSKLNNIFDQEIVIEDYQDIWCGFRPISSDRLPIIGNSTLYQNLYFNLGHANLGFTLSAASASHLIASLASNNNTLQDSFNVKRYKL